MQTRYVDTASTAGGNGTTPALTGPNRAFVSGAAFNAACASSMAEDWTVYCAASTSVADAKWQISGWTANGFKMYVKGNQDFTTTTKISTAKYRIVGNIGSTDVLFYVGSNTPETTIDHVGFIGTDINNGGAACRSEGGGVLTVRECVLETSAGYLHVDSSKGLDQPGGTCKGINCVVRGFGTGVYAGNAYCCDIFSCGRATRTLTGTCRDLIFQNNVADNFGGGTIEYSLSDLALAGTGNQGGITLTFTDKANYNYHLTAGDHAQTSGGIGPGADANCPTVDIDGQTRSGATTDKGVDLYGASRVPDLMPFLGRMERD